MGNRVRTNCEESGLREGTEGCWKGENGRRKQGEKGKDKETDEDRVNEDGKEYLINDDKSPTKGVYWG